MKYRIVEYGAGYVVQRSFLGIIWFNVTEQTIVGSRFPDFDTIKFYSSEKEAKKRIERLKNPPKKYRGMKVLTDGRLWYTKEWGTERVYECEESLHHVIDHQIAQNLKDMEEAKRKKARFRVIKVD